MTIKRHRKQYQVWVNSYTYHRSNGGRQYYATLEAAQDAATAEFYSPRYQSVVITQNDSTVQYMTRPQAQ